MRVADKLCDPIRTEDNLSALPALLSKNALPDIYIYCVGSVEYYGQAVGKLSELQHGVSGIVYIVDDRRLRLRQLNYDGKGPGNADIYVYMWS